MSSASLMWRARVATGNWLIQVPMPVSVGRFIACYHCSMTLEYTVWMYECLNWTHVCLVFEQMYTHYKCLVCRCQCGVNTQPVTAPFTQVAQRRVVCPLRAATTDGQAVVDRVCLSRFNCIKAIYFLCVSSFQVFIATKVVPIDWPLHTINTSNTHNTSNTNSVQSDDHSVKSS